MEFQLVLGTHNQKKRRELEYLLRPHHFVLKTLDDLENAVEVDETGKTFEENARLKATKQAKNLGMWVLGEDSGLSVDALDGRPGIYSSRFSGEGSTDELNNQKLLKELDGLPRKKRTARYTSHISIANPTGNIRLDCEGHCEGIIRTKPAGNAGFGYDPLFEIVEYHRTFAELGDAVKSVLSHRARAFRKLIPLLVATTRRGEWMEPVA